MDRRNNIISLSNVPEELRTAYLYANAVFHNPWNFAYVPSSIRGGALSAEEFVCYILINHIFNGNIEILPRSKDRIHEK